MIKKNEKILTKIFASNSLRGKQIIDNLWNDILNLSNLSLSDEIAADKFHEIRCCCCSCVLVFFEIQLSHRTDFETLNFHFMLHLPHFWFNFNTHTPAPLHPAPLHSTPLHLTIIKYFPLRYMKKRKELVSQYNFK